MQRKFVLALAIFLFGPFAQDLELSFYNKLSALIKEKEPDWTLHRKAILQNRVIIQWVKGQERALIYAAFLSSEEESQKHLRTRLKDHEELPESKFTKSELMGFGDETYLLRYGNGDNRAMILSRKGDQVIEVDGPSEDVAKRFAQHVVGLIPEKKRRVA